MAEDDQKWKGGYYKSVWIRAADGHDYPGGIIQTSENTYEKIMPYSEGLRYEVPTNIRDALWRLSQEKNFPYVAAANLLGSESGFRARAISSSGARGVAQTMDPTLYETLYQNISEFDEETQGIIGRTIEKYNSRGPGQDPWYSYRVFEFADPADVEALNQLPYDPDISIRVAFLIFEDKLGIGPKLYRDGLADLIDAMRASEKYDNDKGRERLAEMEGALNRTLTTKDLKMFYFGGEQGGAEMLMALADPVKRAQNHRAADYADARTVKSNPELFFKDAPNNKIYRSITEFYDLMGDLVGNDPVPDYSIASTKPSTPGIQM